GQLVLPFQGLREAFQDLRQAACLFARAHQAYENPAEHLGIIGKRGGQVLASFDRLDEARHHLSEARLLQAVSQIDQALDDAHTGARKLLEMKAEVDEILARDTSTAEQSRRLRSWRAGDEVEPHASQP